MGLKICLRIGILLLSVSPALWLMLQASGLRQKIISLSFLVVSMFGIYCYATCEAIGTVVFMEESLDK